jgi:glycosyltransferase involved in cell wall biosynthesis
VKVALLIRPDADDRPGGDVVQARAVSRFLRESGLDVQEVKAWSTPLDHVDVAVVMNLTVPEQSWLHATSCARRRVPYVLLPVFWDLDAAIPQEHQPTGARLLPIGSRRRGVAQRLRLLTSHPSAVLAASRWRTAAYLSALPRALVTTIVRGADLVCPNSTAELEELRSYTGLEPDRRWLVVRNGLWTDELPAVQTLLERRDDVVVSVGGISPRKNTLSLVKAARELDCPVLIVGQLPRLGDAYARRVMAEAPENVTFTGLLPRCEVLRLLARAAVHVQPGFVETPGLASLEAAALATPIVVVDSSPVREYFEDIAVFADPHDVSSLVGALSAARRRAPSASSAEFVRAQYDWGVVLQPLLAAVLALRGKGS